MVTVSLHVLRGAWRWLGLAVLAGALLSGEALAERRVALIVGNAAYEHTNPLKNPTNDARDLAETLKALDFDVLLGTDLDDQAFRRLARDFAVKSEDADVALFFYAGHGIQVNGRNFLLPVNAALKREIDLEFETLPLELVMSHMERGERTNIVLLDACRNNPLVDDLARSMGTRSATVGRGLARVETGVGTYVGFSTQPGNVALDGEGSNSPFAAALIEHVATPGLDIETLMRQVREDVISRTKGRQVPWGNSSLVGKGFVFKTAAPVAASDAQAQERSTPPPALTDQANIEIAYWNSIKDSGNANLLEAYLNEYPNGRFARLADILIENLTARDRATAQKQAPPPAAGTATPAEAQPKVAAVDPAQQAQEPAADPAEAGFWLAVKDTGDPKLLEAYLKRYPKGAFVKDAKKLLESIRKREAALPGPEDAKEAAEPAKLPPAVEQPKAKPTPVEKKKPQAAPQKKPAPVKVEKKKKQPAAVAASKPKATPAPKKDDCGWCTFGRSQTTFVCGRDYVSLRNARKCI